jgi:hypothetical protein
LIMRLPLTIQGADIFDQFFSDSMSDRTRALKVW